MQKIFTLLASVLTMVAPSLKKGDSKFGIKETKEALIGVNEVSLCLAEKFKDGVQVTDFTEFYAKVTSDADFKAKVQAAYENYKAIPDEAKDIDAGEGIELAVVQLDYAPKFVALFTKQA